MRRAIAVLLLGLVATAAAWAAPAASTYDVEVMVIEHRLPDLEGGEALAGVRPRELLADLAIAETAPPAEGEAALLAAAQALEKDTRFRVLAHQRWTQAVDAKSATKPVRIADSGQRLEGVFRFYLSRFLHVDMNLGLRAETTGNPGEELVYRLQEHRRIKTQELHYFDHPKFGALVRITQTGKP